MKPFYSPRNDARRDITIGFATVVYDRDRRRWIAPGGETIRNELLAKKMAFQMARSMAAAIKRRRDEVES